jgi:hypothetical protein
VADTERRHGIHADAPLASIKELDLAKIVRFILRNRHGRRIATVCAGIIFVNEDQIKPDFEFLTEPTGRPDL